MNRLSACLITFNEEHNLPRVLKSVRGVVDEIVVVDCGSKDRTPEIAREHGAKLVVHPWTNFRDQKNIAAENASNDWILSLDADEELSPELRNSLLQWKSQEPQFAMYEFPRLTWYLGAWIHHTRWYPDYQRKLYRRDKAKFEELEHATAKYNGPVGKLKGDLLHYTVRSFEEHAGKVENITNRMAQHMFDAGRRDWRGPMWIASPWSWFNNYILCLGFLDGYQGWVISRMAARATWLKYKKLGKLIADAQQKKESPARSEQS